jgi:hypothetical protein
MLRFALVLLALVSGCYGPQVTNGGFACDPNDNPACPSGFICIDNRCINGTPPVRIDKTGPGYSGQHTDPGLATTADCPDESLEPNDGPGPPDGMPVLVQVTPDTVTAKLTKMAICPKGQNPATRRHDVDFFRVDVGSGVSTIQADVYYDITYGDLDVGILDGGGALVGSDGTAVSNACATAKVTAPGVFYVVVTGANDFDVNNYELRVRTFTRSTTCATSTGDLGM